MEPAGWWLDLPFTRPLSLNDRVNRYARAKAVREYREAACWLAKAAKIPPCRVIRLVLVYVPRDRRRRDATNLVATLKAVEDGLVDAQVVPDDTPQHVRAEMPLIDLPDAANPRLQLYVERLG